jgi:class 3 adenylate cyclase
MAAFEDPLDGRAFAAATAVAVAKTGLQVRAGMDAGRVEVVDGEVVGEAVLAASELCRHADAGQVLATSALRDLLGTAAPASPAGPYSLRSLGRTIQLFAL